MLWHSGEQPYWNESAFYEFTAKEVDLLESVTNELAEMTLVAAQHILDTKLCAKMGIPDAYVPGSVTLNPLSITLFAGGIARTEGARRGQF